MLAATYGVAMALQNDFAESDFKQKTLPQQARCLYDLMFKENAPHATTHILSRDYARHLIELSLLHNPSLLSSEEKTRIQRPFQRWWYKSLG
jgi:hypothetical protein